MKKLLEQNKLDEMDFICEGWDCVFHPLEDFTEDEYGRPIFPAEHEISCDNFEPLIDRKEIAKKIFLPAYMGKYHLDISDIEIDDLNSIYNRYEKLTEEESKNRDNKIR